MTNAFDVFDAFLKDEGCSDVERHILCEHLDTAMKFYPGEENLLKARYVVEETFRDFMSSWDAGKVDEFIDKAASILLTTGGAPLPLSPGGAPPPPFTP